MHCHLHLNQQLIDRFQPSSSLPEHIQQTMTVEHGRRVQWQERVTVKFQQNSTEQIIPINIRLYYPVLTVNCKRIDFGTCFLDQTRQRQFVLKNSTCSSSAWSIRKGELNLSSDDLIEIFFDMF